MDTRKAEIMMMAFIKKEFEEYVLQSVESFCKTNNREPNETELNQIADQFMELLEEACTLIERRNFNVS